MSEPTKHHYIPVFYLKRWCASDGRLCEYSRPYKETRAKRKSPKGTGYIDGLYTAPGLPPGETQFIERRFLQLVDSAAAEAMTIMLNGGLARDELTINHKIGWARFLYSLIVRSPEVIRGMQRKIEDNIRAIEGMTDRRITVERVPDPEHVHATHLPQLTSTAITAPEMLPSLLSSKLVIEKIVRMDWKYADLRGKTKHSILTSDRPVIMTNGLAGSDAHIVIPLSPSALFMAVKTEQTFRTISSMTPDQTVRTINHKVSEQAIRYIYGVDDSQLTFVRNRLGKMVQSTPLG